MDNIKNHTRIKMQSDRFNAFCSISGRQILNNEMYYVYDGKAICREEFDRIDASTNMAELNERLEMQKEEKRSRRDYDESLKNLEREQIKYELFDNIRRDKAKNGLLIGDISSGDNNE